MRQALLLLIALVLLGCRADTDEIRIGSNRWVGYGPLYLADDLRWTAPSSVRLVEYPNATGVLRGFRNGLLDGAMLTLDEALILQNSDAQLNLEILLITDVSAGADALFARQPIATLADLKGRRIGVENTALGAFFLSRILDEAQLNIDDLSVISLPVHEHVDAFRDQRMDAVITFASQGPTLEALGAHRLFDSRQLPGEIVDVLVVDRGRVDAQRRKALKALWFDALRTWQEHHDKTDPRLLRRLGLSGEELRVTREGLLMGDAELNRQWLADGQLLRSIQRLSDYLTARGLISDPAPPQQMLPCRGDAC